MENTKETRLKFFAQYYGQNVANIQHPFDEAYMGEVEGLFIDGINYLELKPLSSITDEDKLLIDEMEGVGDDENPEGYFNYGDRYEDCYYKNEGFIRFPLLETYQYLQSKGYALPWMGLSVKQLEEYGWTKLKE